MRFGQEIRIRRLRHPSLRSAFALGALLAAVALPGIGTAASAPAGPAVSIIDFGYRPASLTVRQGTAVIWTNDGGVAHTVTANDGSFDSGPVAPGEAFGNVFGQPGTYAYHCTIHPDRMKGAIVVTAVAITPAPTGPTPPPGTLPPNFHTPVPQPTVAPQASTDAALPSAAPAPVAAASPAPAVALILLAVIALLVVASFVIPARARRSR